MVDEIHNLRRVCLLDVSSLGSMMRSVSKKKALLTLWNEIVNSTSTPAGLRLWLQPIRLISAKSKMVEVARGSVPLFVSKEMLPEPEECIRRMTIGYEGDSIGGVSATSLWPAYIGSIYTGSLIAEGDDIITWSVDPKRQVVQTVFIEYIKKDSTLQSVLTTMIDSTLIIDFFERTILSLREAWSRHVIHSAPFAENILYDSDSGNIAWGSLGSLLRCSTSDTPTRTILMVVADYYRIATSVEKQTADILRRYLRQRLVVWGIDRTLSNFLENLTNDSSICTIPLRLWRRDLDFDTICDGFTSIVIEAIEQPLESSPLLSFLNVPKASEGFIYHSIILTTKENIPVDEWLRYESSFSALFTETKNEAKLLFDSAKKTVMRLRDLRVNDSEKQSVYLDSVYALSLNLTADWLTARVLVDALATRAEYRNTIVTDSMTANVENYCVELRAKLLRITGEWSHQFVTLSDILPYETMQELTYRWDTIRDMSRKIR